MCLHKGEKMKTVVVLGDLNIDIILSGVHKYPSPGKEILARRHVIKPGGSGANVASMLAVNRHPVKFFSLIGNDAHGKYIVEELKKYSLEVDKINFTDKQATGMTVSLTYPDDRMYITSPGTVSAAKLEDLARGYIIKGAHLHLTSYFLQRGLKPSVGKLIKDAKQNGMTTSLDPGGEPGGDPGVSHGKITYKEWDISGLREYLTYLDWFLPNEDEITAITGTSNTYEALLVFPDETDVVVKKGAYGATARFKGSIEDFPGLKVDVVDTTCAGDCFDAGFLYSFCRGGSLSEAVSLGNKYGAHAVSCVGLPLQIT
jgi:sugar/nucleoside kinase (ribokinase family)